MIFQKLFIFDQSGTKLMWFNDIPTFSIEKLQKLVNNFLT